MISTIFGLHVRLADTGGSTILRGDCEPAAFMDLWDRAISSSGGDTAGGTMHQSVLTNLVWADVGASPFLTELRQASGDGLQIGRASCRERV